MHFFAMIDSGLVGREVFFIYHMASGVVPRGEKMLYSGTDPESYITEYTLVYEEKFADWRPILLRTSIARAGGP